MRETIETTSSVTNRETGENEAYNLFVNYAKSHGYGIPKFPTFDGEMRKYCITKQHSVKGKRMTTYIIDKSKDIDWIQRAKPDVIDPKTEEELNCEERKRMLDAIDDDYID